MNELEKLENKINEFNEERDWDQFHSPKNIAMALSVEVAEVVEIFQWLTEDQSYDTDSEWISRLKDELGDVFLYLILLSSKFKINLIEVAKNKIEKNEQKYPVEKARGSAKKYTDL